MPIITNREFKFTRHVSEYTSTSVKLPTTVTIRYAYISKESLTTKETIASTLDDSSIIGSTNPSTIPSDRNSKNQQTTHVTSNNKLSTSTTTSVTTSSIHLETTTVSKNIEEIHPSTNHVSTNTTYLLLISYVY